MRVAGSILLILVAAFCILIGSLGFAIGESDLANAEKSYSAYLQLSGGELQGRYVSGNALLDARNNISVFLGFVSVAVVFLALGVGLTRIACRALPWSRWIVALIYLLAFTFLGFYGSVRAYFFYARFAPLFLITAVILMFRPKITPLPATVKVIAVHLLSSRDSRVRRLTVPGVWARLWPRRTASGPKVNVKS